MASEGSLASFLTPQGITPEHIHDGIVFVFDHLAQQGQSLQGFPPPANASSEALKLLTPRAKQMILLAGEEMKRQAEQSIRPMHLLPGLLNEGEGIGAGLLRTLGFSFLPGHTASVPADASPSCSFCGRSGEEAVRLFEAQVSIAGRSTPEPGIFICDQCVKRFSTILGTV